jgi:hypothetical protein
MMIENKRSILDRFEPASYGIAPLQMIREKHKSSLNVHYQRKIIVSKVLIDAFASSLHESMVLALIS